MREALNLSLTFYPQGLTTTPQSTYNATFWACKFPKPTYEAVCNDAYFLIKEKLSHNRNRKHVTSSRLPIQIVFDCSEQGLQTSNYSNIPN